MSGIYNDPIGHWVVVVLAIALLLFVVLTATAYTVWFERVALGHIQRRPGPNRVGPYGLLQLAADGIKLAFKESFIPAKTEKLLYVVAPTIAVAAAFLSWAVIPIGLWYNVQYWIADINIGILLIFGLSSLNVYAIFLGGYASENKFSLLGGLRSAAQLISYELALGLALVPTFMIVGSLRLRDIVEYTDRSRSSSSPRSASSSTSSPRSLRPTAPRSICRRRSKSSSAASSPSTRD